MIRYYTKLDFCAELVNVLNRGESVANWASDVPLGDDVVIVDKEIEDKLRDLEIIKEEGFEMSRQEIFGILIDFLEQYERECSEDIVKG